MDGRRTSPPFKGRIYAAFKGPSVAYARGFAAVLKQTAQCKNAAAAELRGAAAALGTSGIWALSVSRSAVLSCTFGSGPGDGNLGLCISLNAVLSGTCEGGPGGSDRGP